MHNKWMAAVTFLTLGSSLVLTAPGLAGVEGQREGQCNDYPALFPEDSYRGRALSLEESVADLHGIGFGDVASSVCVPRGWTVVLYEDSGFHGDVAELVGPVWIADLKRDGVNGRDWGDRVSSVKVFPPGRNSRDFRDSRDSRWRDRSDEPCDRYPVLFADDDFRGRSLVVTDSIRDLEDRDFGDVASSVCVPRGWTVVLYEDSRFDGDSLELRGPEAVADLKRGRPDGRDWGDRISSVRVFRGRDRR